MKSTVFRPLIAGSFIIVCAVAFTVYASGASGAATTPLGSAEYHNDRWHFSLAAPADMRVGTFQYAEGGEQLSFTNESGSELFTVTAVPYSQLDLTLGREGDPSTVSDQPDHLEIINFTRADIFKVWFTKDGVLYIVGAPADQEMWLRDILKTWQFD